jgi:hypothetical protein
MPIMAMNRYSLDEEGVAEAGGSGLAEVPVEVVAMTGGSVAGLAVPERR